MDATLKGFCGVSQDIAEFIEYLYKTEGKDTRSKTFSDSLRLSRSSMLMSGSVGNTKIRKRFPEGLLFYRRLLWI